MQASGVRAEACGDYPLLHGSAYVRFMAETAPKLATYDDVLRAPGHLVAEVIDGELYLSPRPAPPHACASSNLGGELYGPFGRGRGGPGGWVLLDEPELHLGSEPAILVPDLAGWRRERMPRAPDEAFFSLAPDWVCEVLSPKISRLDRVKKLPVYAREGVGHVWLVDPLQRTLEVLRNEAGRWVVAGNYAVDDKVRAEPFADFELELAVLWTEPAPTTP